MAQGKAAALRKTGLSARISYSVFAALSVLYMIFISVPHFNEFVGTYDNKFYLIIPFTLVFSLCLYGLTGGKYAPVKRPRALAYLGWFIVSLSLLQLWSSISNAESAIVSLKHILDQYSVWIYALLMLPMIYILTHFKDSLAKKIDKSYQVISFALVGALIVLSLCLSDKELLYAAFITLVVPALIFTVPAYIDVVSECVKEHPEYRKLFIFGRGGAARWGGVYSFFKYDFNAVMRKPSRAEGPIYCGSTLWYDDIKLGGRHIGLDSDSMMLTVAAMGGGKSLYAAWNTLLMWPGGAFVLDPKGEHAQRCVYEKKGQLIGNHIIDPWSEVPHLYTKSATFNPLEEIDITSPNARDDIFQIVESCIMQEASENANSKHFRENAQKIMTGVIVHILSEFPKSKHNLPTVYDTILTGDPDGVASNPKAFDELVDRMAVNEAMGRAAMDAAKVLKEAGENERGGFITTLATGLSWVNTPVLRPILMRSSFKMRDIKEKRARVYVVIPFEHMKPHARFLRTLVSLGLVSCREPVEHDYKTLFLLDEFPQLGTFKPIKEGLVTLRSRNVKIWMHLQNLGQLKERYNNWQDFMSSCDKQFFAVNDLTTAEEISKMLGDYVERWLEGREGETRYIDKTRPLRSPSEVMEELKKGSKLQYVLPADGSPLKLKLVSFKKNFKRYGTIKGSKHG